VDTRRKGKAIMTTIVGLDLSLSSTGFCCISPEGFRLETIKSKSQTKQATLSNKIERAHLIVADIIYEVAISSPPDKIYIEAPIVLSHGGSVLDLTRLFHLTTYGLWNLGFKIITVQPTVLKKFVTGKGNASKEDMIMAFVKERTGHEAKSDDEVDAYWLARMGFNND
jgi:crossover junction endodeoxyribonuclease RuvC